LKKKRYCIFNKQYSKEEYEVLRDRIIEQMKQYGEWGEAPGVELSPFGYNQTVANEYFPLTKDQSIEKGYKWYEDDAENYGYTGPEAVLEDNIANESEEVLEKMLICEKSKKAPSKHPVQFQHQAYQ